MIPSIGRIVHYTLNESDAQAINNNRQAEQPLPHHPQHQGNGVRQGDVYPMMITRVWSQDPTETTAVNGQVFLDGNDTLWVTSVAQGTDDRQWRDPREIS